MDNDGEEDASCCCCGCEAITSMACCWPPTDPENTSLDGVLARFMCASRGDDGAEIEL